MANKPLNGPNVTPGVDDWEEEKRAFFSTFEKENP